MPQMTDPSAALESFQEAFTNDPAPLKRGAIDPELFVHLDYPTDKPRFTYVRIDGGTVTALVMFAFVGQIEGEPLFQIGYAVPERYRGQGRAKEIVVAAIAELKNGFRHNGVHGAFCIEAVVGIDNESSMRVAAATISSSPVQITDNMSGLPALHYVLKIEVDSPAALND
jgi:RimJ/RimL family protein N-acetyltransferase